MYSQSVFLQKSSSFTGVPGTPEVRNFVLRQVTKHATWRQGKANDNSGWFDGFLVGDLESTVLFCFF